MSFLRFVEQQRAFRRAFAHAAEIANFTESSAKQQAERFLILEFAHVEPEQLACTKNLIGCHDYRFRFADAGWAEQQETSAWTTRLRQSEFATPDRGDNSRQRVGLAADFARQQGGQFVEFGELRRVCCFVHP